MKSILIYSGGLDSTVLLFKLLAEKREVFALSIDYGHRHRKELEYAKAICRELGIVHKIADLRSLTQFLGGSSLTDDSIDVPEGHYEEESMKATVVPNRNMVFLSVATSWAVSLKADSVVYGAHSGDHAIYPDCRENFAEAMSRAIELCDWHKLKLERPFVDVSKANIAKLGAVLNVPVEKTWSCYQGRTLHCGRCGTCLERREAFYLAKVGDPTEYETAAPSLDKLISNNWRLSS